MAFTKITNADITGKGVVGLPDVPGLSTGAMQAKFDELALDVIIPAYNQLIDLLNGTGVADYSKITDPTDNVVKSLQMLANNLKTYIDTRDATKADVATTLAGYGITDAYTKSETDTALAGKADNATTLAGYGITDAYTKTEADNLLAGKADNGTSLSDYGILDAYTKTQTDNALATKADKATTLAGYGITDAYKKTEVDTALSGKVDKVAGKGLSTNDYDNTEKGNVASNTAARHTHTNKATLDAIDATTKGKYDALVTLLNGIVEIEAAVTNDATKIPTGAAIVDYVSGLGGGDMLKATYDANGDDVADVKVSELTDATITTPSNGQVLRYNSVTQKWENDDITEGHTIENPSGTDMTQRTNLQFTDAHLTDDSVNDRTEVENIKDITSADYASATEDGFYNVTDESDEELTAADIAYDSNDSIKEKIDDLDAAVNRGSVSVTADQVKDRKQLQYELFQLIDASKINKHSLLSLNGIYYQFYRVKDGDYYFTSAYPHSNGATAEMAILSNTLNNNAFQRARGASFSDLSSEVPMSGFVYELFY